jgi:acyl carrier protein
VRAVVTGERRHRAGQMRERRDVVGLLERLTGKHRREPQDPRRRRVGARDGAADRGVHGLDDLLEHRAATVETVDAHRHQQARVDQLVAEGAPRGIEGLGHRRNLLRFASFEHFVAEDHIRAESFHGRCNSIVCCKVRDRNRIPMRRIGDMEQKVREILAANSRVADATQVAADADLYALGLTSHASVNVMLALEEEFDVEFPDELLKKETFSTVRSIVTALSGLVEA